MSPEDKQSRLKELSKPGIILSDQEWQEKEQLEEELSMIHKEEINANKEKPSEKVEVKPEKKRKRTLFEVIQEHRKKKKQEKAATWDEIQQLKLERAKAFLQRDIARAQAEVRGNKRNGWEIMRNVLGSSQPTQNRPTKGRKQKEPRDNLHKVYDRILGENDDDKINKTFW